MCARSYSLVIPNFKKKKKYNKPARLQEALPNFHRASVSLLKKCVPVRVCARTCVHMSRHIGSICKFVFWEPWKKALCKNRCTSEQRRS